MEGSGDLTGASVDVSSMARCVYVWPLNLMGAYYADLHGDCPVKKRFQFVHLKDRQLGVDGFRSSLVFDFDTSLVPEGHITLSTAGRFHPGLVEAERSAMMIMLEAVRNTHQLFPSDYNYVVISEKRALFNAMKDILPYCRSEFIEMSLAMDECLSAFKKVCNEVSIWIGENQTKVEVPDVIAVGEFHAALTEQSRIIHAELSHVKRKCEMIVMRQVVPDGMRLLELTVPMTMVIDWEHSFTLLHTVYNAAIKKLGGLLSNLKVAKMRDGQVRASVEASVMPKIFAGGIASSEKAALAKLYYEVIKHVNVELGYSIIDWHYPVRQYIEEYIDMFDFDMGSIMKCGFDLDKLLMATLAAFDSIVAELTSKLDINDRTEGLIEAIQDCSVVVHGVKHQAIDAWKRLKGRQVERSTLESKIAGGV